MDITTPTEVAFLQKFKLNLYTVIKSLLENRMLR